METERLRTKFRAGRQKSGFTLRELAERLRINLITLQRIETGKSSPSVELLSVEHSVTTLEKLKFVGIYIEGKVT